jgi:hypothetical protein
VRNLAREDGVMSLLPAGAKLEHVVPELDRLLEDPESYLREAPLRVGPRRMYGVATLFAVPAIGLLIAFALNPHADNREYLAIGIALLLGAFVWLVWGLRLAGHSLVLHREGLEVRYRDTTVWCPWALFNTGGEPFVPESDSPLVGLTLPIDPEVLPWVELRRNDTPIAWGARAQGPQLRLLSGREVVLPARYEVQARELGKLLMHLGQHLGAQRPVGHPPDPTAVEAFQPAELAADPDGWLTVALPRLRFPPCCCCCLDPTDTREAFPLRAIGETVLGVIATPRAHVIQVPVCPTCLAVARQREQQALQLGFAIGALLFGVALGVAGLAYSLAPGEILVLVLGGVAVGGVLGLLLGGTFGRSRPIEFRRYAPAMGTLQIRFRNPEYMSLVIEAMRRS